jgi:hypothetical protein
MILDIIFVRHGLSCANTLAKVKYGMHLLYQDPELANSGVEMSQSLSANLIKNIQTRWSNEPYTVGSSQMIRAQETAYYMIASTLNKPINIFPHVGESGFSSDNYSMPVDKQRSILSKRGSNILKLLDQGKDGREEQTFWEKANFSKFISWATENPDYFSIGSDGSYRAVIFSHSHFLSNAFNMKTVLNNNDALHTIIDTSKKPLPNRFEYWILNRGSKRFLCPDGCRISVCTKKSAGRRKRYTKRQKLAGP